MANQPIQIIGSTIEAALSAVLLKDRGCSVQWRAGHGVERYRPYLLNSSQVKFLKDFCGKYRLRFDRALSFEAMGPLIWGPHRNPVDFGGSKSSQNLWVEARGLHRLLIQLAELIGVELIQDSMATWEDPMKVTTIYDLSEEDLALWSRAHQFEATAKQKFHLREIWLPRGRFEKGFFHAVEYFPGCVGFVEPHGYEGHVLTLISKERFTLQRTWERLTATAQKDHSRIRSLVILNPAARSQESTWEVGANGYIVAGGFSLARGIGRLFPFGHGEEYLGWQQVRRLVDRLDSRRADLGFELGRVKLSEKWHNAERVRWDNRLLLEQWSVAKMERPFVWNIIPWAHHLAPKLLLNSMGLPS